MEHDLHGAVRAIALCWLAHALRAAVARLRLCTVPTSIEGDARVSLLSMASGRDPTVLPSLLRALAAGADVQSAASVAEARSLAAALAHASDVVVVCVEIDREEEEDTIMEQLQRAVVSNDSPSVSWVFVGFSFSAVAGLTLRTAVHASSAVDTTQLETAARPLDELRSQCGLRLALELLAKLTAPPLPPTEKPSNASLLASPVAPQLPFQLLAMLLRWSFFHPRVVALLGKPFQRKLALIPQPRVRHEVAALYEKHTALWIDNVPNAPLLAGLQVASMPASHNHFTLPSPSPQETDILDDDCVPPLQRLSQCALWDKQKQFYRDQGIHAWSNHLIPFGVSSSSYLAMQYARLAVDFLTHAFAGSTLSEPASGARIPNCFVWEAASGSCKFLHTFLLHFYDLVARDRLEERFGIVPCVVASDLSEQVLRSREEMGCFQHYIADGKLDFAVFDTDEFLHSELEMNRGALHLRHAGKTWHVGHEHGPVFIIGNYFFDSLRTDVFVVTQHESDDGALTTEIREAQIDPTTDNIPDMLFSLAKLELHPRDMPVYAETTANRTLVAAVDRLEEQWRKSNQTGRARASSSTNAKMNNRVVNSSLILFPTEALEFLDAVLHHQHELSGKRFPVVVVTGDATFSYRDAVPRSFIDEDSGDLEIPQLSPHPDCFCLPVDLEILQLAVDHAHRRGSATIVSTPSSDTFNVFFAQSSQVSESSRHYLSERFHNILDQFTPCDCDLLWGLMSVDDGAKHLSSTSQLSLLAQTAWDFDVFSVVQWGLLYVWKKRLRQAELAGRQDVFHLVIERDRHELVEVGQRSLRTLYVMDERAQDATTELAKLQFARWFYGLRAFEAARQILDSLVLDHPRLQIAATYLSGLVAYHRNDLWAALGFFRKGQQLEPKRLRLKKWVARTLIRLQEAKVQSGRAQTT